MRIPLSWLQEYIDLPEDVEALGDLLTYSGLEVEGVETIGSDFAGIVVAQITAVDRHPDADKLTLCTIEYGAEVPMTVVCGAPNVRVGMKTIYAPVGVTLPNGLKLKKAKIRGVESLGMLCAEDELGLSSAHDGIMDLDTDLPAGTAAAKVLGGPEIVFELEVTPNRPDCLSVIGVARELSALTGRELRLPDVTLTEEAGEPASDRIQVQIEDPEGCPRYTARVLTHASLAPAPEWMQQRLRLCDVRPINNLVDITNYVMLETGQPLHAFDYTLIHDATIRVRRAMDQETMATLDDQDRLLTTDTLVIADADRPVAIAGVMGGADSEIKSDTSTILLESAAFQSSLVRATAKRLNLHTESSYRFARGCDMHKCDWVSRRAAHLFQQHAGAKVCSGVVDAYPGESPLRILTCRWQKVTDLIGVDIPIDTMRAFFSRLELEELSSDDQGCSLRIPGFRNDLIREVDLIEEVARLHGLDKIPSPPPIARVVPDADDRYGRNLQSVWRQLAGMGLQEAMHYSLTSRERLDQFDADNAERRVVLPNPISQDQTTLRTSLIPQMVETLGRNHAHGNQEAALFEVGSCFHQTDAGVDEPMVLSVGLLGPVLRDPLDKQRPLTDAEAFYALKGVFENLFTSRRLGALIFAPLEDAAYAPGQAAGVSLNGKVIGRMGILHADHRREWKLMEPVAVGEVNLTGLLDPDNQIVPVMSPIPAFPGSSRDVALIVDRDRTHADIMAVIDQKRPFELESVELFDVFEGKKLGENRKSVAYRFSYRHPKKTLTDDVVEKLHGKIVDRLIQQLNADVVGKS